MMPRLAAEEELKARAAAVHPYLEGRDQAAHISRLARAAGLEEAPKKLTKRSDLAALGIRDVTGEDSG